MTLEEAIKHAEEVAEKNEWFDKNCLESMQCRECAKEYRQLAEWLKELKQLREQTEWTPVTKKQPDKSGYYWCTFGGTNTTGRDYYWTKSDAKKYFDDPEKYVGWRSQNVIAWMSLPKPYKESEEKR